VYPNYYQRKSAVSVWVINDLDQDVTVQIKGNRVQSTTGGVNIGSSWTVPAGSSDFKTLTPDTCGWAPYLWVELSCSTAPTSGSIDVYLVRDRTEEEKLVDGLEIRDTSTHDPSTDPDKMFIKGWD